MIEKTCPTILKYTNNHLWLLIENNHAYIGITAYAQKQIGKVKSIHINKNELNLSPHTEFGFVEGETGKILELIMPFKGKIIRTNLDLLKNTSRITTAPYMAWIAYFNIADKDGLKDLLSASGYKKLLKTEMIE